MTIFEDVQKSIMAEAQKSKGFRIALIEALQLRTEGSSSASADLLYSIPQKELVGIIVDLWDRGFININDLKKIN